MDTETFGKHLTKRHPGVLVVPRALPQPGVEHSLRAYHRHLHRSGQVSNHDHREL
jgi:hypothetical protein